MAELDERIKDTIEQMIATAPDVSKWREYGFKSEEEMAVWVDSTVAEFSARLRQLKEPSHG